MKITVKTSLIDFVTIDTNTIDLDNFKTPKIERYSYLTDEKWIKFCKDHNFHPIKDAHSKIYDLYLEFCINDMI